MRHVVELRDDRYVYRLRLDATGHAHFAAHRDQFHDLIGTVEPVPASALGLRAPDARADVALIWAVD